MIGPGKGEVIVDAPDRRVEILAEHDALHATWSRFGPRRDGADLHVHRRHSDYFYVLDGELTLRVGADGERVRAGAGALARLPPLVAHGYRNETDSDVRFLNFHAPGSAFATYMRALRDGRPHRFDQDPPPDDGGRPAAEASVGAGELVVERDGVQVMLLSEGEAAAFAVVSAEPGGEPEAPHVHRRHPEAVYVLEGDVRADVAGRPVALEAGSWLLVASGAPHSLAARGHRTARFLSVHAPSCGFGAFIRVLGAGGDDGVATRRAVFDREPAH